MNFRVARINNVVDGLSGYAVLFVGEDGRMYRLSGVEMSRDKALESARHEFHAGLLTAMYRDNLDIAIGDSHK